MAIPFIRQFPPNAMYPKGKRVLTEISLAKSVENIARHFITMGGRYVIEILPDGQVRAAACLQIQGEQKDVEVEIGPNGPPLREMVEKLVRASEKHVPSAPGAMVPANDGDIGTVKT